MAFTTNATINSFGGRFLKLSHKSAVTGTPMNATLYLPGSASSSKPAPLLIYLSGRLPITTCTHFPISIDLNVSWILSGLSTCLNISRRETPSRSKTSRYLCLNLANV